MRGRRCALAGIVGLAALLLSVGPALAGETVVFTINSSLSNISMSGQAALALLQEQDPGSLITSYSGTISTEMSPLINSFNLPSEIRFISSSADAAISGNWRPGPQPGGDGSTSPADYGALVDLGVFGNGYAALRNINLGLTSGQIPVSGNQFASSQTGIINAGFMDFETGMGSDRSSLGGQSAANAASPGSISVLGTTATLTVPFDITIDVSDTTGFDGDHVRLYGTLVGTAQVPVPEPASMVLLVSGVLGLITRRR